MKNISLLILLSLTLVSCGQTTTNQTKTDTKIKEEKVVEVKTSTGNLNNNTTEKMSDKTIVKAWDNIAVTYTGKLEDGTIFDATEKHGWEPLKFTVWAGQMIKGFDAWVVGMKLEETKIIEIEAADAYGEHKPELKQVLQKKDLVSFVNAWVKLEKWEKLPTQYGMFEIIDTDKETVTIDANHALAWKKLTFEVKVVEIK